MRVDFYEKYGGKPGLKYGFGRSEIDFMKWEVERGVLDPVRSTRGGRSPWWRAVNADFLYASELGRLCYENGVSETEIPAPSSWWVKYIKDPSEDSWYMAHNASIVAGYQRRKPEAERERRAEQVFVNAVLYRLLYAQGLVKGVEMGRLGTLLADPELPAVDAMVHLPDFYPRHYPLTRADVRHVMHQGHSIEELAVRFLDEILIVPELGHLYDEAAEWLDAPELRTFLKDGEPVYPSLKPSSIARHTLTRILHWISDALRLAAPKG